MPRSAGLRRGAAVVRGARANNLRNIDVAFPLGTFIAVTGVSGSGKSTLVNEILYRSLARVLYRATDEPGAHAAIEGIDLVDKVIQIDQSPIGRTPGPIPRRTPGCSRSSGSCSPCCRIARARLQGRPLLVQRQGWPV
jgi:excinuclease ABC subunit A